MMIAETSILINTQRVITLPKGLKDKLKERGWADGRIFLIYDEDKDIIKVVKAEKVLEAVGFAEGRIYTEIWDTPPTHERPVIAETGSYN